MPEFAEFDKKKEDVKKRDVLNHWRTLTPSGPIVMRPKPVKHFGSGLDFDTVRISGSQQFIDGVLARLKDILNYDGSGPYELKVSMDEAPHNHAGGSMTSYVFYCSLKQSSN